MKKARTDLRMKAPGSEQHKSLESTFVFFAVALFGFSATFKIAHANFATLILLIMIAVDWRNARPVLRREPYVWLMVAFLGYLSVTGVFSYLNASVPKDLLTESLSRYARDLFLPGILLGYWLYQKPWLVQWLLLSFVLGYLALLFESLGYNELLVFINTNARAAYGSAATLFGFWSLVILFSAWALLYKEGTFARASKVLSISLIAISALAIIFSTFGVIFSKTRGAWLVAVILVPIMAVLLVRLKEKTNLQRNYRGALYVAIVVVGVGWSYSEIINDRMMELNATMVAIYSGDRSEVGNDGLGYRINVFSEGYARWKERPLFGWGPGSDFSLLRKAEGEFFEQHRPVHYHNEPLNFAVELGLLGLLFYLTSIGVPLYYAARALPVEEELAAIKIFSLITISGFLLYSMSDLPITSGKGRAYFAVPVGMALYFAMNRRSQVCQPLRGFAYMDKTSSTETY